MNPKISLIAAIGKNRELGKDNKLLFSLPEDMKRFRTLTSGHTVIMGRKTFESIGHPLPNRLNIIISRSLSIKTPNEENLIYVTSIEKALEIAKQNENDEIFIIGGGQIYSLGIKYADKLYLTFVDREVPNADVFFPEYKEFNKITFEEEGEENGLKYKFIDLTR